MLPIDVGDICQKLLGRRIAHHSCHGRIGVQKLPGGCRLENTFNGVFKNTAVLRLGKLFLFEGHLHFFVVDILFYRR